MTTKRSLHQQFAAGLLTALVSSSGTPVFAAAVALPHVVNPGFGSTGWILDSDQGTSTGLPYTGHTSVGIPGFGFDDAHGPIAGASDAYDTGWTIFINNAIFVAPGGSVDLTGTTMTAGPVAMSGMNVTVQHYYSPSSAVARIMVFLTNPTATAIAATVDVPVNFGSDNNTVIRATSSGDLLVTTADRWIVTSDGGPVDSINTTVLYGPGAPTVTPAAYTQTVFDQGGTQGIGATFNVNIPAGTTRSLMFFAGLGGVTVIDNTVASAQTAAALFNNNATLAADWLSGLSAAQQAEILNWNFPPPIQASVPELSGWQLIIFGALFSLIGLRYLPSRRSFG